jgi:TolA-binding protein
MSDERGNRNKHKGKRSGAGSKLFFLVSSSLLFGTPGCAWDFMTLNPFQSPTVPEGPADSLVLHGDRLEPEKAAADAKGRAELEGAHELYRRGEYGKAETVFRKVADNKHNSPQIAEEARYYEAECLRRQENYPKAADVFNKLLNDFHFGAHREQAMERMFEIANYWLEDTREEMHREKEQREGKRWFVMPASFVHVEKNKPLLDEEGRALEKLEQIVINDVHGRRAADALFLAGSVKFYREDYKEADRYFTQLVEQHPNSERATEAMEYAIISKNMSTGGSDYDSRKAAEARKYVDIALRNYSLPPEKNGFMERALLGINLQQAEKDYKLGEFYRHTGHPGSAWFYYEIVRRRYPGTPYYHLAVARMQELKAELEKKGKSAPAIGAAPLAPGQQPPGPAAAPAATPEVVPAAVLGMPTSPEGTPMPQPGTAR